MSRAGCGNPFRVRTPAAALADRLGGSHYRRPVLLFAAVLALDSADKGAIGAVAPSVRDAFHVGNAGIGLLAALSSLVGAVATVPVGMLADRVRRVPLLAASTVVWSLAMAASGAAISFVMLVLAQLALGAVTATAGPALASLVGDVFPQERRGRIYGYIIAGELAGAGAGLVISENLSALLSWRWAFWVLAAAGLALTWALRRFPEPARGHPMPPGERDGADRDAASDGPPDGQLDGHRHGLASRTVQQAGVEPDADRILTEDPARMPLRRAVSYVLRVPSNLVLIVASALGYYFFTGLRTFAVSFLHAHFGIGQAVASSLIIVLGAGAFVGVLVGGRVGDGLLRRGRANGRVIAAITTYFAATALLIPGLLTTALVAALPLYVGAAAFLAAANPPLDAARLDIMPAGLWGRAEAVRTVCAAAPTPAHRCCSGSPPITWPAAVRPDSRPPS